MSEPTILFTCCGGAGGWSILRSLSAVGRYRLIGVDGDGLASALYQPELAAGYVVPHGDDPGYVDHVLRLVRDEGVDVVWPVSDEEIVALTHARDAVEATGAVLLAPPAETVDRSIDKLGMARRAAEIGVPAPVSCRLDEVNGDFPTPVIVRPIQARSGNGVVFFDTIDEVLAYRDALGLRANGQIVQERLVNRLGYLHMAQAIFDREQELLTFFSSRSTATRFDWGGPALGGVPVRNGRLKELALAMLEAAGDWFGPVNTEFLYDPERRDFYFIEINPRYWGYSYLATAAGLNFPDMSVRLALGETVEPQWDYRTDVVTMMSREHLPVDRARVMVPLPGADI